MFARHGSLLPCSQKFAFLFKFGNTCLFLFQISVHLYFKYLFIYISNICSFIFQISVQLYFKYLFIYISNICSFIFQISVHLYFIYLFIYISTICIFICISSLTWALSISVQCCKPPGLGKLWGTACWRVQRQEMYGKRCQRKICG